MMRWRVGVGETLLRKDKSPVLQLSLFRELGHMHEASQRKGYE